MRIRVVVPVDAGKLHPACSRRQGWQGGLNECATLQTSNAAGRVRGAADCRLRPSGSAGCIPCRARGSLAAASRVSTNHPDGAGLSTAGSVFHHGKRSDGPAIAERRAFSLDADAAACRPANAAERRGQCGEHFRSAGSRPRSGRARHGRCNCGPADGAAFATTGVRPYRRWRGRRSPACDGNHAFGAAWPFSVRRAERGIGP